MEIVKNLKAPKKVLIVSNSGWSLYNFRLPLARALREHNITPIFVSPFDQYVEKIRFEGFGWIELKINRRGLNPLVELLTFLRFFFLYKREKPTAVHHFTIKCILYGSVAGFLTKIPAIINALVGLDHVFVNNSWRMRLIRSFVKFFYQKVLSAKKVSVIFQNKDDLSAFEELKLTQRERVFLIRSSGVDIQRFIPVQTIDIHPLRILFIGNLLFEKGIREYVEAVRILKLRDVKAIFEVAGDLDVGNPSSISKKTLDFWKNEKLIEFYGYVEDIVSLIARASIVVLPSYREGVPRSLLEAAAMAKPLIATDVPGCREIVEHSRNGYLVPVHDPLSLANAIELLTTNLELRDQMGKYSRTKVVREFDDREVAAATLKVYEHMGVLKNKNDFYNLHSS